jgi:hypothetical protein
MRLKLWTPEETESQEAWRRQRATGIGSDTVISILVRKAQQRGLQH